MVYTFDLRSNSVRIVGSSPTPGTYLMALSHSKVVGDREGLAAQVWRTFGLALLLLGWLARRWLAIPTRHQGLSTALLPLTLGHGASIAQQYIYTSPFSPYCGHLPKKENFGKVNLAPASTVYGCSIREVSHPY